MGREFYFMNKFISKIAVALVGCAMAVGVGVAIGNNSSFSVAEAATEETVVLTRSCFASGSLAYNVTDDWTATASTGETVTGKGDLYSTQNQTTLQTKNTGVSTHYRNTSAIPGAIKTITLDLASGTDRSYTVYASSSSAIVDDDISTMASVGSVNAENPLALPILSNYVYFYLKCTGGSSTLNSITISYYEDSYSLATYTVSSKTSVSCSGTTPSGSAASYSQTYNTLSQATSGNSFTVTLSGYDGKRILGASVSVHSNDKGGSGSLTLVSGSSTISSISASTFASNNWNGAYTSSYVNKGLVVDEMVIGNDATVVLTITATANSLFFQSLSIAWEDSSGDEPSMSLDTSAAALVLSTAPSVSRTITYENLTGTISAVSTDDSVASCSLTATTGDNVTGTKTLTITGLKEGYARIDVSDSTDELSGSIEVTVSRTRSYTMVTSLTHVPSGSEIVLITSSGNHAMASRASGNYLSGETVSITNGVATISNVSVNRIIATRISEGENAGYYTLYDTFTSKYLYKNNDAQLKEGDSASGSNYYWKLLLTSAKATISNKADENRYIRWNNGNSYFGCYTSSTNGCLDLNVYVLTSDLPSSEDLTNINGESTASVEAGSSIVYSGTYLPINATEAILALDDTDITVSEVIMDGYGNFTITITADENATPGDAEVILYGEDNNEVTLELAVTITAYEATHILLEDENDLFSGMRVIIANTSACKVASSQSTNNVLAAEVRFGTGEDEGTLSNVSGNGINYVVWEVTLDEVTGWVFYNDGGYLAATGNSGNNYLKSSSTLDSRCLFDVSISNGHALITGKGGVDNKYMKFNNTFFSCYGTTPDGDANYVDLYMYVGTETNDELNASGYENAFLRLDGTISTSDRSDGTTCKNGLYDRAKENYSSVVNKTLLSQDALERLDAWATANGEVFDAEHGTFTPKQQQKFFDSNNEIAKNSTLIIVAVVSLVSLTAIGGYFFIRRRKER